MNTKSIGRPEPTEYFEYYGKYTKLVGGSDILATLKAQLETTLQFLKSITPSQADFRYAPEKWSMKQVIGHVIDTERIFAYRAVRFARNDQTPVEGFEQDDYVKNASFDQCSMEDLASEFNLVRQSNIAFFTHLDDAAWLRKGVASNHEVSVRALAYILAGHELHHLDVLKTRYV